MSLENRTYYTIIYRGDFHVAPLGGGVTSIPGACLCYEQSPWSFPHVLVLRGYSKSWGSCRMLTWCLAQSQHYGLILVPSLVFSIPLGVCIFPTLRGIRIMWGRVFIKCTNLWGLFQESQCSGTGLGSMFTAAPWWVSYSWPGPGSRTQLGNQTVLGAALLKH